MPGSKHLAQEIRTLALEEGFARVGIASAGPVRGREMFDEWLLSGGHADMSYLARNVSKRFCPSLLVEGAQSVICLAIGYCPTMDRVQGSPSQSMPFVARYARGRDYHDLLRERCKSLIGRIRTLAPQLRARAFVDSAPLAERSLAAMSGVGWIGRNGCLIVPGLGSYVFLAEIVCNLKLPADGAIEPGCGTCDACCRACPTGACVGNSLIDARKCLSYLTIEHHGPIDRSYRPLLGSRIFGCDTCQEVCPYNQKIPAGDADLLSLPEMPPGRPAIHQTPLAEILTYGYEDWDSGTSGSAMRRVGHGKLIENAVIAAGCSGDAKLKVPLRALSADRPGLSELIRWALNRLE